MKVIPKIMDYARACLKQLLHRQKVSHTGWFMGCREAFLQSLFACILSHNSGIGGFMFSEYMFYPYGENHKFDKPIICCGCGEIFNFPTIVIHGKLKFLHMTIFLH